MVDVREASKCPKCGHFGEVAKASKVRDEFGSLTGEDLVIYICVTEVCPWFHTGWAVQSDAQGNIPERNIGTRGMDKTFERMSEGALSQGRAILEEAILRDAEEGEKPGA